MSTSSPLPKPFLTETLRNLQVAIRSSSLYTVNHPTSVKAISAVFAQLQKLFENRDVATIQIQRGTVFFDRTPLDRDNLHVKRFVSDLSERAVAALMLQAKLTLEELTTFMSVIGLKPAKIEELGGLQSVLSKHSLPNIKVSVVSLSEDASPELGEDSPFGGMPIPPELAVLAQFFAGKEVELSGFESRFLSDAVENPMLMAQVMTRTHPDESSGEHPVVHYLRCLDRLAGAVSAKSGDNVDQLKQVLVPVTLAFDEEVRSSMLTDGRDYATSAGRFVSRMYGDLVNEMIADRVRSDFLDGRSATDLGERIKRLLRHSDKPDVTVAVVEQKLLEAGMSTETIREFEDHLHWAEYTPGKRASRLMEGDRAWAKDFEKIRDTLNELVQVGEVPVAAELYRGWLRGLWEPDDAVRQDVSSKLLKLLDIFPVSKTRETLLDYLSTQLPACLREESAVPVAEAQVGAIRAFMVADLSAKRFDRPRDLYLKIEEMLRAPDVSPWKADLVKSGMRRVGDPTSLTSLVDSLHLPETGAINESVATCLKTLGPSIIDQMIVLLADEPDRVRRARIVAAIQLIGPPAENTILSSLTDERWYVVRNLAILLGDLGGERSVFSLEKVLYHRDARVIRAAVRSLAKIGTTTAHRVLARAIERGSDEARLSVIQACATPGNSSIVPQLLEIVRVKASAGSGEMLRRRAIEALGRIGSEQAVAPLIELLEKKSLFSMAEDVDTRLAAARALGQIGGGEAEEALERSSRKDPKEDVRAEAERLLSQLRS